MPFEFEDENLILPQGCHEVDHKASIEDQGKSYVVKYSKPNGDRMSNLDLILGIQAHLQELMNANKDCPTDINKKH
jgi:hypothetical protein